MTENLRGRVAARTAKTAASTAPDEAQQHESEPLDGSTHDLGPVTVGEPDYEPEHDLGRGDDPEQVPVVVALARVMRDVLGVGKNDRNTQQNFNFRGIDAVLNKVGPAMRTHGVIPMPQLQSKERRDVETKAGNRASEVNVEVRYRFYGPKGDFLDAVVPGESMDSGDKATAKAMSVAMRTALIQALALPTTEPDPDEQVYERAPEPEHPADIARRQLAEAAAERKLDFIAVRKAFAYREGIPVSACGDAGLIRGFTAELMADPKAVLATPKPTTQNGEPAQNGAKNEAPQNGQPVAAT